MALADLFNQGLKIANGVGQPFKLFRCDPVMRQVARLDMRGAGVRSSDPEIGRAFLDRLMQLVGIPSIDLVIHHGGAGAPDLAIVCAGRGIVLSPPTAVETESAWAFGDIAPLAAQVTREAIAV